MEKEVTYTFYLHFDLENKQIGEKNIEKVLDKLFYVNKFNIKTIFDDCYSKSSFDAILNRFLLDMKNKSSDVYACFNLAYQLNDKNAWMDFCKNFILKLIYYKPSKGDFYNNTQLDIMSPNSRNDCFVSEIPNEELNKVYSADKLERKIIMHDEIALWNKKLINDYILLDYYVYLYETDRLDNFNMKFDFFRLGSH